MKLPALSNPMLMLITAKEVGRKSEGNSKVYSWI
jgi:hypothetical protein